MALGKPVIGTRGASFEEMLDEGKTGFLVSPGSATELAEKVIEAWTHPRLNEIAEAARAKAREFAPESVVQTLIAYYHEVIAARASSS